MQSVDRYLAHYKLLPHSAAHTAHLRSGKPLIELAPSAYAVVGIDRKGGHVVTRVKNYLLYKFDNLVIGKVHRDAFVLLHNNALLRFGSLHRYLAAFCPRSLGRWPHPSYNMDAA